MLRFFLVSFALLSTFACTCGKDKERSHTDTTPPSWPDGAMATLDAVTETAATLTWPPATDDVGVVAYVLTSDGAPLAEVRTTTHSLTGLAVGQHARVAVVAKDAAGNESPALFVEASGAPRLALPTTDESISTDFCAAMQFLFTGPAALQHGATASTLPCSAIAAIHGKARSGSGSPLPGLTVAVVGHPEFGRTITRGDGNFDLAVTAGVHVVRLSAPAFLPVEREVVAQKGRYTHFDGDVVLLRTDDKATSISLPAGGLHTSTLREDASGRRQVRVYIPPGTTALAELADGTTRPLSTVTVRVTEYTVGARGHEAMPAQLPEASAYTFAAEFTVDEARALGATGVRFSQPVATWVDNFLESPLCTQVPQGRYDARQSRWVAEPSSVVVRTAPGGLDVTGDGVSDSDGFLLEGEAAALASAYSPGASLVRTLSTHFSPRDDNYPWQCEGTCTGSNRKVPQRCPGPCRQRGSVIDCHNQSVSESWGVSGAGFRVHLHSHRQPQRSFRLDFPLTTDVDGGVRGALAGRLVLDLAGQLLTVEVPDAGEGAVASLLWDGKDGVGRTVRGPVEGTLQAGFIFGRRNLGGASSGSACTGAVLAIGGTAATFGNLAPEGSTATGPARQPRYFSNSQSLMLGNWVGPESLGGLSLEMLHGASASTGTIFYGDGEFARESDIGATVRLYAGGGTTRLESGPALGASLNQASHLVAGTDGSLYFVDNGRAVRRLSPDGTRLETVAGNLASRGFSGDGADAKTALFSGIDGLAVSPAGDVYVADTDNQRIRRVDGKTGVVTTWVGSGTRGVPVAGEPALTTKLDAPRTMLWGRDGRLYFFSFAGGATGDVLFRLTEGRIEKVAGGASSGGSTPVEATSPHAVSFGTFGKRLAQGPDGSLYVSDNRALVRKLAPDGRVTVVAGGGTSLEDGVRGKDGRLGDVMGVAADAVGNVYFADRGGSGPRPGGRVRLVGADGRVITVAGDGALPAGRSAEFDKPGTSVSLGQAREVVVLADGRVVFAESFFGTLQALQRAWDLSLEERGVGSRDGAEVYVFDAAGRHRRTIETLTGTVTWRFTWDAAGRLASIADRNGDVTTVLREADGRFAGFRAQDGQETRATLDEAGRVTQLSDARQRTVRMTWNADGRPASWTDENGGETKFLYGVDGKLSGEVNALGGTKSVSREETRDGYIVTYSTPEGRTTRYQTQESGQFRLYTNTFPDGTQVQQRATGGREVTVFPDGTTIDANSASDTRFGSQSPYTAGRTTRLPSGLSRFDGMTRKVTLDTASNVLTLSRLEESFGLNRNVWTSVYTASDRTRRITTPMGRVSSVTVDDKGRPVSWTSPGVAPVQVTYDSRGRLTRLTQAMRNVNVTYGANGFPDTLVDALNRTTRLTTDATGQLDSATRPDGEMYAFGWDAKGNLTGLTPPGKPAHGFAYSKLNEVTGYIPPALPNVGTETYSWNRDSEVTSIGHPDGSSTTVTRDAAGRATQVVSPWATTTLEYSSMTGQRASSTRGPQRLEWQYDGPLLARESSSGAVSGSVSRRYDTDFRVAEVAVNDAGVSYTYDADGLLTAAGPVSMARSASTGQLLTAATGIVVTSYTYDLYGAPASIETRVGGAVVFREALAWDNIGRITAKDVSVQGAAARWDFTYDAASRLREARRDAQLVGSWAYDGNSNRISADGVAATFDTQDRQVTAGATTFGHDAFGNRTRKTEGTQVTQFAYDGVGGLLSATLPDSTRLEYVIDGRGRRVGKKRTGNLEKGWLYDGQLRIAAELDGTGAVVSRFIYGTRSHSPDVMVRGGVTYRYVYDVLGSVRLLVNVANGQVAQRIDYDPWGVITSDSSPDFQPFGFAGGLFDTDTRLTRFGARDYDAATGRWMSKDPIGFGGGANHFSYCQGSPTGFVDLNGLRVSPIANVVVRNAINSGRLTTGGQELYSQLESSPYEYTFEAGQNLGPDEDAFGVTRPRYDQNGNYTGATIVIDLEKIAYSSERTFGDVAVHEISHAKKYDSTCGKPQGGPAAEKAAYRDSYDYREEMFKKTGRKEYDPIEYLKAIDPVNCPFPNACGSR